MRGGGVVTCARAPYNRSQCGGGMGRAATDSQHGGGGARLQPPRDHLVPTVEVLLHGGVGGPHHRGRSRRAGGEGWGGGRRAVPTLDRAPSKRCALVQVLCSPPAAEQAPSPSATLTDTWGVALPSSAHEMSRSAQDNTIRAQGYPSAIQVSFRQPQDQLKASGESAISHRHCPQPLCLPCYSVFSTEPKRTTQAHCVVQ